MRKVSGVNEVVEALKKMDKEARKESMKTIRKGVNKLRNEIKKAAPVKTGVLRKSVKSRVRSLSGGKHFDARVIFEKEGSYWIPVEFGQSSRGVPPKPFVYNTRDRVLPGILDSIEADILKKI